MIQVLHGIEFGVVLAFLVGPVFFTVVQTSVERGFLSGVMVALGVSLSDMLYVAICYLGLVNMIVHTGYRIYMAYAGGVILIAFGMRHVLFKSRQGVIARGSEGVPARKFRCFVKGFVLNGLSPSVLIFWLGTLSYATLNLGYTTDQEYLIFFASLLATVLGTDIAKAWLADRLRALITPRFLRWTHIIVGLFLSAFGLHLLWSAPSFKLG
ncbi:MAG: LysE family translocator [Cyclobacteriaceae bacterium]|nr:LysE family translocator [Cyclobacteriaceae bacterium]